MESTEESAIDTQAIVIGIAFVLAVVVIYIVSLFSMKEKTFEEVMAEQKRREDEEREKIRNDRKAEKDLKKKNKKGKDKGKEKSTHVEPEIKDEKMVNLEIEPEIIEPLEGSSKKSKVKKSPKSILVNKGEKGPVTESDKAEELPHSIPTPKDVVEQKHDNDRFLKQQQQHANAQQPAKSPKKQDTTKVEKQKSDAKETKGSRQEEMVVAMETRQLAAAAPSSGSEEKKGYRQKSAGGNMIYSIHYRCGADVCTCIRFH
jgi:hypothetical protein